MILKLEDIQNPCRLILNSVDTSTLSDVTDKVELYTADNILFICVTNGEYMAKVSVPVNTEENLFATVNSDIFLKLISQLTSETVEIYTKDNNLIVVGNGTYKIPMIFDGESVLHLKEINIEVPLKKFNIKSNILKRITDYNSMEFGKGTITKTVQKLFYVDEHGAITFTNGACVNSFELKEPIKLLLTNKLVKLFKLFDKEEVLFEFGYNSSGDTNKPIVKFTSDRFTLDCILNCDDVLMSSVPVSAIRGRVEKDYEYTVSVDRNKLIQAIKRLSLFNDSSTLGKPYGVFNFSTNQLSLFDVKKENKEDVKYEVVGNTEINYSCILNLKELETTLETFNSQVLNILFGDEMAVVIKYGDISVVLPECSIE